MQIWMNLLVVLQMVAAIAMIGLVLVQHGKGADMGASFGSGSSGSLFGATGSANFLSRTTAICATVFFLSTLGLAFFSSHSSQSAPAEGSSVLERAAPAVPQIPSVAASAAPVAPAASK
ncbi:preprotein translocase subunit SecG [Ideonella sp.]|uniref:preprotein translocase subunit SecG n=1 Tax=Ideonella sp. TaxID=1929293 RepID=UPI003BB4C400